jgi:putative ABC transport system permease protein
MVRREDSDMDFREYRFHYADANVFDVFDILLLKGDPKNALEKPNTVVITEDTAKKYYGDEDPIGKILVLEDGKTFRVTGIAENIPSNSTGILISWHPS